MARKIPIVKKYICEAMPAASPHKTNGLKGIRWPVFSMILAILAITGFQGYWLKNNYDREKQNLDINTNAAFRQTILKLQASKLRLDRLIKFDSIRNTNVSLRENKNLVGIAKPRDFKIRRDGPTITMRDEPTITIMNLVQERLRDTINKNWKDVPMVAVKGYGRDVGNDSFRVGKGISIRTRDNNFRLDELDSILDPAMITRIDVDKHKNPDVNTITINYGNGDSAHDVIKRKIRDTREIIMDSVSLPFPGKEAENIAYSTTRPGMPPMNNAVVKFLYNID
jgi:hypothetical protein